MYSTWKDCEPHALNSATLSDEQRRLHIWEVALGTLPGSGYADLSWASGANANLIQGERYDYMPWMKPRDRCQSTLQ